MPDIASFFARRHEHLRSTSPSRSSIVSLPQSRSQVSVASSKGGKPGTVKKVDRVQRYQQLQQGWSKDR